MNKKTDPKILTKIKNSEENLSSLYVDFLLIKQELMKWLKNIKSLILKSFLFSAKFNDVAKSAKINNEDFQTELEKNSLK